MGRKRKVVTQDDGTPVEIETDDDAAEIAAEVDAVFQEGGALVSEPDPVPSASQTYGVDAPVEVVWTELGEQDGVMSEYGLHKAGDVVLTRHSATLIASGYAEKK